MTDSQRCKYGVKNLQIHMNKSIHKNEKNMCTNTSAKEEYIWESKENRQTSKEVNTE